MIPIKNTDVSASLLATVRPRRSCADSDADADVEDARRLSRARRDAIKRFLSVCVDAEHRADDDATA
jgi:hypothetical protein